MKFCHRHGIVPATGCTICKRDSERKRRSRQRLARRDVGSWRTFRKRVIDRDGGACLHCGDIEDLTAHFVPRGPHAENLDDYETLCRRCHGREHGAEASRAAC